MFSRLIELLSHGPGSIPDWLVTVFECGCVSWRGLERGQEIQRVRARKLEARRGGDSAAVGQV